MVEFLKTFGKPRITIQQDKTDNKFSFIYIFFYHKLLVYEILSSTARIV